ncbi:MAG: tRNA-dihydrouridine synthase [Caldilineaceae bacterium]
MTTFWQTLPRPIMILAPMDGITDQPFRHIQKKYGDPMLIYTEFVSAEAICQGDIRRLRDLLYDESQRPIVAQIYGFTPEHFRQVAILLCELGFDGIDINMGCPAKNIANAGAGAGLIRQPKLAQHIVRATTQGVHDWQYGATVADCPKITPELAAEVARRRTEVPTAYQTPRPIPVSVKTRIGFEQPCVEAWIPALLDAEPAAIGIHGRTLEQGYSGAADWEQIGRAVALAQGSSIPMLGNGDVASLAHAQERVADYGVDGVLIGRAAFGNPFFFRGVQFDPHENPPNPHAELLPEIALEHARLFEQTFQHEPRYNFHAMRKHLGWYARRISPTKHLRIGLVQTNSPDEVAAVFAEMGKRDVAFAD